MDNDGHRYTHDDNHSANEQEAGFYQPPPGIWSDVDAETRTLLVSVAADLQSTLAAYPSGLEDQDMTDGQAGEILEPAALALRLGQAAQQLFGAVAGAEGDMR